MKKKIILKSVLRKPIWLLLGIFVLAASTFAFLLNLFGYIQVERQVESLSGTYKQIRYLDVIGTEGNREDSLPSEAITQIEESDYVAYTNPVSSWRALMPEVLTSSTQRNYSTTGVNTVYFYGTVLEKEQDCYSSSGIPWRDYPDGDSEKERRYTYEHLDRIRMQVNGIVGGHKELTDTMFEVDTWLASEDPAEMERLFESFVIGQEYLIKVEHMRLSEYTESTYLIRPLEGFADSWVYPIQNGEILDFTKPEFSDLQMAFDRLELDLHMYRAIAVTDMSTLPEMQSSYHLMEGRLLTEEDTREKRNVCVIRTDLAIKRNLNIGDTLKVTVGDTTSSIFPYLALNDEKHWAEWEQAEKETLELEIVGIVRCLDEYYSLNHFSVWFYMPESLIPEAWIEGVAQESLTEADFSFVLRKPEDTERFLKENETFLANSGVTVTFLDNGWNTFSELTTKMKESWLLGIAIFGVVILFMLIVVASIWLRSCRKEQLIMRALGTSQLQVDRQLYLLFGSAALLSITAGAILGYLYAASMIQKLLAEIRMDEIAIMSLPMWYPLVAIVILTVLFWTLLIILNCRYMRKSLSSLGK